MVPDSFYALTIPLCLAGVVVAYFCSNPIGHGRWFLTRRFINWLPLGMTYAFLCMGRFNLIVAKGALGALMTNENLGLIFTAGTWTYALSFLVNGPLIDKKIGGKNGILIAAAGASLANAALGILTWLITVRHLKINLVVAFSVLYSINMYFQSFGAMSIIKIKAYWFHVRERGVFGAIFGTFISAGGYFAFDWSASIVSLTRAGAPDNILKRIFGAALPIDATWAVFFIPAAILVFWLLVDIWLIVDTPEDAGFPHLDTHDASSGQMHVEFSVLDLLGKIFASRLMLMIACVELTAGVFRYAILNWYLIFSDQVTQPGAEFFGKHWGWFTCIFGIIGGFGGGIMSDRLFQSRRGPPAALLCGSVLVVSIIMALCLFSSPLAVGWSSVLIFMASIGITSMMSATAATDFGGRKATATCSGIVDAFAYIGGGLQSICIGYLIPETAAAAGQTVPVLGFARNWLWWPLFIVPFAVIGGGIALWIWNELPAATKKYIADVEKKEGLTGTEIPLG
ncbi:MAG TPA: MFS transporter [Verrucomicrobiae bacterium]|jgi:OPA family glycerol-3-phosphate transporter-like MFS transporter|nr:MFS transporter [Verrucomicrobiae bacterium]